MSSPEVAKENKHQIREIEHLLKAILEQKNGLARRIFSKDSADNTRILEATDKFIQRQPKGKDEKKTKRKKKTKTDKRTKRQERKGNKFKDQGSNQKSQSQVNTNKKEGKTETGTETE